MCLEIFWKCLEKMKYLLKITLMSWRYISSRRNIKTLFQDVNQGALTPRHLSRRRFKTLIKEYSKTPFKTPFQDVISRRLGLLKIPKDLLIIKFDVLEWRLDYISWTRDLVSWNVIWCLEKWFDVLKNEICILKNNQCVLIFWKRLEKMKCLLETILTSWRDSISISSRRRIKTLFQDVNQDIFQDVVSRCHFKTFRSLENTYKTPW